MAEPPYRPSANRRLRRWLFGEYDFEREWAAAGKPTCCGKPMVHYPLTAWECSSSRHFLDAAQDGER